MGSPFVIVLCLLYNVPAKKASFFAFFPKKDRPKEASGSLLFFRQ